jgi:ferredoxin
MAIVRFEGKDEEVQEGQHVIAACERLGIPFGCQDGLCGTCISKVIEGADNLAPKNSKENAMGLKEEQRLPCQCVLNSGTVEFALD